MAIGLSDKLWLWIWQKLGFKDKILIVNFSAKLLKSVKSVLDGYGNVEIVDGKSFFEKEDEALNIDPSLKVLIL